MPQPLASQSQEFVPLFVDVENSNVGVTALQSPVLSSGRHPGNPWHPKVTVYRLVFVVVTFGLGTAKAFSNGSGSAVSVTIEWASGIVFLLLAFFLTDYEGKESAKPFWFFKADVMIGVRAAFRYIGIRIPEYDTEERTRESLRLEVDHPSVTGYRIMVTATAISFGMAKAALSYHGLQMAPTAVEWAYGVVVTLSLYILGLYELCPHEGIGIPWLFTTNYSSEITSGGKTLGIATAHLTSLTAVCWSTLFWYGLIPRVLKTSKEESGCFQVQLPTCDLITQFLFTCALLCVPVYLVTAGITIGCVNIIWLGRVLGPVSLKAVQPLGRSYIMRRLASWVEEPSVMLRGENWVARLIRRIREFCETCWYSVLQATAFPRLGWILFHAFLRAIALTIMLGLTSVSLMGLPSLWIAVLKGEWIALIYLSPFAIGLSIAVPLQVNLCIIIVWSCFRINVEQ